MACCEADRRERPRATALERRGLLTAATEPKAAALAGQLLERGQALRGGLLEMLAEITCHDAPSGNPEALEVAAGLLEGWLREISNRTTSHAGPVGRILEAELGDAAPSGGDRSSAGDGSSAAHGGEAVGGAEAGGVEAGGVEARGAEAGEILILCHYDTVWPVGTVAERGFEVRSGVAYGPGVLDMRGGIVAVLGAMRILGELDALRRPVRILMTPDEETGGLSSRELIAARARGAAVVLVPEPALPGGRLKTARKGWIVYRMTVTGLAAHAGLEPELGVSAIDELVDQLARLRSLADPATGITVNCGELQAANPVNMVAEHAEVGIDIRLPDLAAESRVRSVLAALTPARAGAKIAVEELHCRPPFERTEAIASAFDQARALAAMQGVELGEGPAGGVSDANVAAAQGAAVLDGLGPEGGGAHAVQEHASIDSLVQRTALIGLLAAELR